MTNRLSLVELDLDLLFDDENEHVKRKSLDRHCRDAEWSSSTTISLEHDVSKVLQEPAPVRNLGAIPKKCQPYTTRNRDRDRERPPRVVSTLVKSESERSSRRRYNRHLQEHQFNRNR